MNAEAPTPLEVVERYVDAIARFDYPTARACLADDDFRYSGPINTFHSADALMRYLELATPIVQRVEIQRAFEDGEDVAHFMVVGTQLSEKLSVHVAQWAHVRDGRIDRIAIVFDAYWYRSLFPDEGDDGEPRAITRL
jgi:limonene-1,2-epoxide hydrolase